STPLKYRRGLGGRHGFWDPRKHRVAPICIPIGTHLPHAMGLAWAAKIRGDRVASVVWFGEGATSEGDFHEALNFAAVFKVATVFFCTNNQWAISTPFDRQTATPTVAEKADAYGVPGVRVDGFDVIACHQATADALARARAGEGPTLIEAFCYRIKGHATADDPSRYRDAAEAERWAALEPVARTSGFLRRRGLLDDATERAMRTSAAEAVGKAVREMESIARPSPDILFEPVYAAERPWTLVEQSRERISD
ncbi:MAG: thiamine pyrophosphate-dependent enzyme, partial [Actinomycetota bacterium]